MSGHSKWSTIKRAKGVADVKRGLTFTKIANAITIAAKIGGSSDPNFNPRLRVAMDSARAVNMPKDNIQRAIDKGLGKLPGQTIEEVLYEGFGPGGAAFMVEGVTDNKLRTSSEIKNIFEKSGGTLGGQGSVAHMFDKKGEIRVRGQGIGDSEQEKLELIDLGAREVEDYLEENLSAGGRGIRGYLVYVESSELNTMGTKVTQAGFGVDSSEIVMKPNIFVEIKDKETIEKVTNFVEKLEEHGDILKVYSNFEVQDEL